jgi:bifunctional non-homologous end joining protein LigD
VCLGFSRAVAEAVAQSNPKGYTTKFAKAGRADKILIDYLRNNRTNTSVAAYSTRANAGATVSMPLTWKELSPSLDASSFTVVTVPKRLTRLRADPWADYWTIRQKLTRPMLKAIGV